MRNNLWDLAGASRLTSAKELFPYLAEWWLLDKTREILDVPKEPWGRKRGERQETPQLGFIGKEKPCFSEPAHGGCQQEESFITKDCKDLKIFRKMLRSLGDPNSVGCVFRQIPGWFHRFRAKASTLILGKSLHINHGRRQRTISKAPVFSFSGL